MPADIAFVSVKKFNESYLVFYGETQIGEFVDPQIADQFACQYASENDLFRKTHDCILKHKN